MKFKAYNIPRSPCMNQKNFLLIFIMIILAGACGSNKGLKFLTIGTGGVTGVYYPTGGAIARMINNRQKKYKIRATAEATSGSVYNINAVLSGDLDLGIAQSDRQYQAFKGLAEWEKRGAQKNLRAVFSIHPESVTLVASDKSTIKSIADIKGKQVNLGNPGSGHLQNSRDALKAFGITEKDINPEYIKAVEAAGLLQDERIDAFFYTVGHPNGSIKEATSGRIKVRIIELKGPSLKNFFKKFPYYTPSTIPRHHYPNAVNKTDISTFGVRATLVTAATVSDQVIYAIVKEVFSNLEEFKKLHPAYEGLTAPDMLKGLTAPLHPGALKYYREAGLKKHIRRELILSEKTT